MCGKSVSKKTRSEKDGFIAVKQNREMIAINSSLPGHELVPTGCVMYVLMGGRLHQPSPVAQGFLIFIIIIHILTFPFTAVLNALVMIAVKVKSRLRDHKSNILLALLASTDFTVGVIIQPTFVVLIITFLLDNSSRASCALQVFTMIATNYLVDNSLLHLVFISGERYLAMKHSFAYITLVTEARLLVASALAWLLSAILQIPLAVDKTVFAYINNTFLVLSITIIVFCHITVYLETCRHEQQLAAQQVTQEAREQFEKDKKALKLTRTIIAVLTVCCVPMVVFRIVLLRYRNEMSIETVYICFTIGISLLTLNSLLNPIIYSVRMRQFRLAFIELACRTVNITEAEEIEMRVFSRPNAVVRVEVGHKNEGQDQQNVNNNEVLPAQHENVVVGQPNRHSI